MKYFSLVLIVVIASCSPHSIPEVEWQSIERDLQLKIIQAESGETIEIPEGNFLFTKPLIIDGLTNVTIKGAGIGKTTLSFADQTNGAEGIKAANCTNLAFEDFTILDSKGDNIKVSDTKGVRFTRVSSGWTGEPKEENGAYAFYPVLSKRVIVEECIAIGASDAGIYVGQSDSVIIRNNEVYWNVAGIESENSRWVEIYGNNAHHNTGGILVFDLPGLTQQGHTTRVYDNVMKANNYRNFAPEGNIVATVPEGTGMLLLATRNIEIFNNDFIDNRTLGAGIVSYELVKAMEADEGSQLDDAITNINTDYDPFPNKINLHDNRFSNKYIMPTFSSDFGLLFFSEYFFDTPDIAFDGIYPEEPFEMCFSNNGEITFMNLDGENDLKGLSPDWSRFDCEMEPLGKIW